MLRDLRGRGPGPGKTEVVTLLVLRLLFVEGDPVQPARVPRSISPSSDSAHYIAFVTTCSKSTGAPNYQNVRLMDEVETSMFVYEKLSIVDVLGEATDRPLRTHFSYLFSPREWQTTRPYLPSKWNRTAAAVVTEARERRPPLMPNSASTMRSAGGSAHVLLRGSREDARVKAGYTATRLWPEVAGFFQR
jgi:hypothetical protein